MLRYSPLLLLMLSMLLTGCGDSAPRGNPGQGKELYTASTIGKSGAPGCITCHSLEDGEVKVGPSHSGIVSRAKEIINSDDYNGRAENPDEFLKESLLSPDAYIEGGFPAGVMYQKYQDDLSEQDVENLVAFLMTLR
jgi:cytochrome c2